MLMNANKVFPENFVVRDIIIIIIIIFLKISQQCKSERELEHSINLKSQTPHYQPVEGRKI